jgi:hypothetical protein
MNLNDTKLRNLSRERMQDRLQEAERDRLIRLASSTEGQSNWVWTLVDSIKDNLLDLFRWKDTPQVSRMRRTGSLRESESS